MAIDFSLYLITDRRQVHPEHTLLSAVAAALEGGVTAVQLREKDLPAAQLYELGLQLRRLTRHHHARLFINDRIDIALAVDADGVHLTEQSLSVSTARRLLGRGKWLAASTHSLDGARRAEQQGADLITFSPIYATASKLGYGPPQGLEKLHTVCQSVGLPVFALGGITAEHGAALREAGATGVAVISAILAQADPRAAAQAFFN